ncbi:hypothetical protein I8D64_16515 [Brachybacterium sp. MASK1Z-5]|uniref:Uncharacterized protein n=1 Tax=Brachybacterium halotolerans TaxID=2795215 RepID=A0ABS1BCW2_9MICO|nr:hypothetical protein [Brachybacterium halotolerans]MBK0332483.1 hypothetical protein [Brachybacterium halotolerans]MBK0333007.1 hypothetical protein [Brachybacterium halotolerans]
MLHSRDGETSARVVIGLEDASPRSRAALLAFLPYLRVGVDVIAPRGLIAPELDGPAWRRRAFESARDAVPSDAAAVVTAGQGGPTGAALHSVAERRGLQSFVVQTDVLTPYAAPLPTEATVLSWSADDADFWRSGREDLTLLAVGSQRLWQLGHHSGEDDPAADGAPGSADTASRASADPASRAGEGADPSTDAPTDPSADVTEDRADPTSVPSPVVLGQLSRIELPSRLAARAASSFCRDGAARYLPEAEETGRLARTQHRLWERRGIEVLPAGTDPLTLRAPVVSILAAEVLEVAARGGEAWVHAPGAPGWVHEFWHRYGMRRHGTPTPAPAMPEEEPAARIAREVENRVEGVA